MERICVESTNYTCLKSNHMFIMTLEKLKAFLMVLLVSGYARLPRQMYWETMMTKTEFLESEQYSHLADNNVVNSSHKFTKK